MWPSYRIIIFLAILGSVCGFRKHKSKIATKKNHHHVNTTKHPAVTHTHKRNGPALTHLPGLSNETDYTSTTHTEITSEAPTHTPSVTGYNHDATGYHHDATGYHHDITEYHHNVTGYHQDEQHRDVTEYHHEKIHQRAKSTAVTETTSTTRITPIEWEPAEKTGATDHIAKHNTSNKNFDNTTAIRRKNGVETTDECHFYKATKETKFDLNKMADIWQTTHYNLQEEKLPCFKIYIKKVTEAERQAYKKKYGTFKGKVYWDHIFLEVKALTENGRKHFLQGTNDGKGVMTNVIITEEIHHHALREESANQWIVVRKLLLMRDCDSGGYIAFTKVPHIPSKIDLTEALADFGETYSKGTPVCEDEDEDERINDGEAHYEPNDNNE